MPGHDPLQPCAVGYTLYIDAHFRVRMLSLRAGELAGGAGVGESDPTRMPALWIVAHPSRDVVVRDVGERGCAVGGFRYFEAARRVILPRLAQRRAVGEEAS